MCVIQCGYDIIIIPNIWYEIIIWYGYDIIIIPRDYHLYEIILYSKHCNILNLSFLHYLNKFENEFKFTRLIEWVILTSLISQCCFGS